ncbi:MAG TPA: hypothetical protein VHP11_16565 [Tepidisphaeraceae bacterium]|nr:hypothetical protein [Tepidisphaeraceae bacterium]
MPCLSALALLLGLVLLYLGLRGRRIDDHPLCRHCGFDLFGLPPTSTVCSECGHEVRRKRAIRIGHRHKFYSCICLGLLLLLPSAVGLGIVTVRIIRSFDPDQYKPVQWLLHEASAGRTSSLATLLQRADKGQLTDQQVQQIADRALELQADRIRPWVPQWGDFIEQVHTAGQLPEEKWTQYFKNNLRAFHFEVRPMVRCGAPVPFRITYRSPRIGGTTMTYEPGYKCKSFVQGNLIRSFEVHGSWPRLTYETFYPDFSHDHRSIFPDSIHLSMLKAGLHTIKINIDAKFYRIATNRVTLDYSLPPRPDMVLPLTLQAQWEQVNEPTVKLNTDPSLRQAVFNSLSASIHSYDNPPKVAVSLQSASPPTGLAFDVYLRADQTTWKTASIVFIATKGGSHIPREVSPAPNETPPEDVPLAELQTLDLILRPSIEAAENTVDLMEIWGEEIVLKDLPILRPPPRPRP